MSEKKAGTLYLFPTPLSEKGLDAIPAHNLALAAEIDHFVVETEATGRGWIARMRKRFSGQTQADLTAVQLFALKHDDSPAALSDFLKPIRNGVNFGLLSDAGCPGVADPGAEAVAIARYFGATIKPLTGPSSLLLALMASGLNGQKFAFQGYLPREQPERERALGRLEALSAKENQTQIFIETPYRNEAVWSSLLKICRPDTLLCIALDISSETESIETQPISQWRKLTPDLKKRNAIFLLLAAPAEKPLPAKEKAETQKTAEKPADRKKPRFTAAAKHNKKSPNHVRGDFERD